MLHCASNTSSTGQQSGDCATQWQNNGQSTRQEQFYQPVLTQCCVSQNIQKIVSYYLFRDERVKEEHIDKLEKDNHTVKLVDFDTMLDVLEACDNLTDNTLVNRLDTEVADSEVGFWSLIRGIIPGKFEVQMRI